MLDSFSKFLQLVLVAVATAAIPFVVVKVFNTLSVLVAERKDRLTAQQLALIEGGLQIFVASMNQSGLLANILAAGEQGLRDLADAAEKWLSERGLPGLDLSFLLDMLKHELIKQGIPFPPLVADPEGTRARAFALTVQLGSAFK